MSRYDVERFDPAPDPDLVCCICQCVLDCPMESPCRHVYCQVCIETWLKNRQNCPTCRKNMHKEDLKPALPIVQNMINRLKMKCKNFESGCLEPIQLELYENHIRICDYETIFCQYIKCGQELLRGKMEEHRQQCPFREVECPRDCKLMIPVKEMDQHDCMQALQNRVKEQHEALKQLMKREQELNQTRENLEKQLQEVKRQLDESQNRENNDDNSIISDVESWEDDWESVMTEYTIDNDDDEDDDDDDDNNDDVEDSRSEETDNDDDGDDRGRQDIGDSDTTENINPGVDLQALAHSSLASLLVDGNGGTITSIGIEFQNDTNQGQSTSDSGPTINVEEVFSPEYGYGNDNFSTSDLQRQSSATELNTGADNFEESEDDKGSLSGGNDQVELNDKPETSEEDNRTTSDSDESDGDKSGTFHSNYHVNVNIESPSDTNGSSDSDCASGGESHTSSSSSASGWRSGADRHVDDTDGTFDGQDEGRGHIGHSKDSDTSVNEQHASPWSLPTHSVHSDNSVIQGEGAQDALCYVFVPNMNGSGPGNITYTSNEDYNFAEDISEGVLEVHDNSIATSHTSREDTDTSYTSNHVMEYGNHVVGGSPERPADTASVRAPFRGTDNETVQRQSRSRSDRNCDGKGRKRRYKDTYMEDNLQKKIRICEADSSSIVGGTVKGSHGDGANSALDGSCGIVVHHPISTASHNTSSGAVSSRTRATHTNASCTVSGNRGIMTSVVPGRLSQSEVLDLTAPEEAVELHVPGVCENGIEATPQNMPALIYNTAGNYNHIFFPPIIGLSPTYVNAADHSPYTVVQGNPLPAPSFQASSSVHTGNTGASSQVNVSINVAVDARAQEKTPENFMAQSVSYGKGKDQLIQTGETRGLSGGGIADTNMNNNRPRGHRTSRNTGEFIARSDTLSTGSRRKQKANTAEGQDAIKSVSQTQSSSSQSCSRRSRRIPTTTHQSHSLSETVSKPLARSHTRDASHTRTSQGGQTQASGQGQGQQRSGHDRWQLRSNGEATGGVSTAVPVVHSYMDVLSEYVSGDEESDASWSPTGHEQSDISISDGDDDDLLESDDSNDVPKTFGELLEEYESDDSDDSWTPYQT